MAEDLIKYAFAAGEVAPTLFGRGDLEKYDLAVALARNWYVDYRGGISTRPGTEFLDFIMNDDKPVKMFPFKFAPSVAQTYVLLLGENYIRFIQNGAYVLEAAKTVTGITQASPGVVTSAGHGFATGDWVKIVATGMTELNNRSLKINVLGVNTFELLDPLTGAAIDTTAYGAFAAGTVARIYTVVTTYLGTDLELLRAHQSRSVVYFTHPSYPAKKLTRVSGTSWTFASVSFGAALSRPGTPTVDAGAGTAGVGFQITAVDANGQESQPSDYGFDTTAVNYTTTAGQAKVTWAKVNGAIYYKVYRTSVINTGSDCTKSMAVGFVGIAYGTVFVDPNIVPNFAITPPNHSEPFANGSIQFLEVTAGGAGYTNASVVTITTSTGSGFVGYAVQSGGVLLAIIIVNGGSGYVAGDTVNVSVGAGATIVKTLSAASGNNPATSSVFQQRKIYAGTDTNPLTIWGSQPADYENFDVSTIVQESDSYEFELDSDEVAPIRHLLATRSGLVIVSQAGIWQLTGGQGVAVTPTNALADPQSYTGCSVLPPLPVDTDILYVEGKGATVRLLAYNDYTKVFAGQDLSILSNHLITPNNPAKAWAYASDPNKLVLAVRKDGMMPVMTLVKEQNIFGWASWTTRGLYKDVLAIQEDQTDVIYSIAQRLVNGRYTQMLESFVRRDFVNVEDAWCVDAGLRNTYTYPAAGLTASAATGTGVTFTASAAVFSAGDVGKVLRVGGGKAIITAYTDTTHIVGTIMQDITKVLPEVQGDQIPLPALSGEWTLDANITAVTGLWHLEGQTVKILADGNVLPDQVVTNGSVTFSSPATRIIIGLGFRCIAKTLPPTINGTVVEGKVKRNIGVKARLADSRGLKVGSALSDSKLYPMKERTDEAYAEPTRLQSGIRELLVEDSFNYEAQLYYVQDYPLPATILSLITDTAVGNVSGR